MWLRGHISVFALGSVILLAINLLRGSGGIWADTAIGAWAVLVLAHGILLVIARLLQELMADEEDAGIRPASEMHWNTPSTWTLPHRVRDRATGTGTGSDKAGPRPTLDPEASAAAAAARERKPKPPQPQHEPSTAPVTNPEPEESERVSWQTATDAAWLASNTREETQSPESQTREKPADDEDDFTPLKFD